MSPRSGLAFDLTLNLGARVAGRCRPATRLRQTSCPTDRSRAPPGSSQLTAIGQARYQRVSEHANGFLRFCGRLSAWPSGGRGNDASSTPARCCSMQQRTCSPKKVSRQPLSMTSLIRRAIRRAPSTSTSPRRRTSSSQSSDRYWRRYFDNFAEVMSAAEQVGPRELDEIAAAVAPTEPRPRRRARRAGPRVHPLSDCVIPRRANGWPPRGRRSWRRWREFIVEGIDRLGGNSADPAVDVRPDLVATSDAVVLGSRSSMMSTSTGRSSRCTSSAIKLP